MSTTSTKLEKRDIHSYDDLDSKDFFGPRPPPGYAALRAAPSQILLPLTVSNKCGQAFRWRGNKTWEPSTSSSSEQGYDEQVEWSLCLSDRVILLRQDEHRGFLYHRTLLPSSPSTSSSSDNGKHLAMINAETERWLNDYLNLDVPLEALYAEWEAKDPVFARFATRFTGLRMLRQDPWECLCAFVCSSNNNIARIGQMVQNLCTHFAPPLLEHTYPAPPVSVKSEVEGMEVEQGEVRVVYHPFPPPEALAKEGVEERLRELGFGYRAKYLARTAQMLCEKHGRGVSAESRAQKTAEHLDESHWLYGIKAEEQDALAATKQPESPVSIDQTVDDSKVAAEEEETPSRKRARRTSTRSSRKSSASSTPATSTAPSDELEVEPEEKQFDSVRSYLQHLRTISYHDARAELIQFPGVGPKVADCILLMSLDQASSIPVDRHVFQFAEKWYRLRTKKYQEIADYFRELWGEYAGWAHSVLFTADLRSFANYNNAKKEEKDEKKVEGDGFWGTGAADTGYPTPPASQSIAVKQERSAENNLQAVHSPPRMAIPELVPQSLVKKDVDAGATLAERIKGRPKRKSRTG